MTKPPCAPILHKGALCLQLFLAMGAVILSGAAPAQDACTKTCDEVKAAFCHMTKSACTFDYRACLSRCKHADPAPPLPEPTPCACCSDPVPPPVQVDHKLVGTWELRVHNPAGVSRWVWEIHENGTYRLHAEGPGAPPAQHGSFQAYLGHYRLISKTSDWTDQGAYQLDGSATLITESKLGKGVWRRVQP